MHAAGLEHLVTYPSQNRNQSPARRDIYQYMRLFWSSSRRKSNISGKVIPPDRSLSRSHGIFFFKCVSSFDVHILHLLILMRALRKSWEQRETSAPRGMCSLLEKAVTAVVWATELQCKASWKGDEAHTHFHWNLAIVKFGLYIF